MGLISLLDDKNFFFQKDEMFSWRWDKRRAYRISQIKRIHLLYLISGLKWSAIRFCYYLCTTENYDAYFRNTGNIRSKFGVVKIVSLLNTALHPLYGSLVSSGHELKTSSLDDSKLLYISKASFPHFATHTQAEDHLMWWITHCHPQCCISSYTSLYTFSVVCQHILILLPW